MTGFSWKRAATLLIAAAAFTPAASQAGFVVDFTGAAFSLGFSGATDAGGGAVRYDYAVQLVDDGRVDPNDSVSDFFTLYDVFGIEADSIETTGLLTAFTASLDFLGRTAANTAPVDAADVLNLTFTYDGAGTIDAGEDGQETALGTFSFVSTGRVADADGAFVFFTGQATKDNSVGWPGGPRPLSTISEEKVPGPEGPGGAPAVPEPGTLTLLAMGGLGLAGGAIRKRRKAAGAA